MDRVKAEDAEARNLRLGVEDRDVQLEGYIRLCKQLLEQEEREQRDGQGTADRIRCDRRTLRRLRREILTDRGNLAIGDTASESATCPLHREGGRSLGPHTKDNAVFGLRGCGCCAGTCEMCGIGGTLRKKKRRVTHRSWDPRRVGYDMDDIGVVTNGVDNHGII